MTEDDLRRTESAIARPRSAVVRWFFLHYPPELRTTAREMGPDDQGERYRECAADYELCDTADAIFALNAAGLTSLRPLDWSPRMLIVDAGGCGEVYRFESGQTAAASDSVADSVEEFAAALIESYGGD
jgi:hypothetical protein